MLIEKRIAYEDEHVLIVKKPVGMASQSEKGFAEDCLSAVLGYRTRKGEPVYGAVINRLDKPVGGLVLIAKDRETAGKLSALSGEHSIEKKYYALVTGTVTEKGEYTDELYKDPKANLSYVADPVNGVIPSGAQLKKAKLLYEPVGTVSVEGETCTLLRIKLLTGRHHQIRVQMAYHGHPLYGDCKYNPACAQRRDVSPALYAYRLSFANPYGADHITVECLPETGKFPQEALNLLAKE